MPLHGSGRLNEESRKENKAFVLASQISPFKSFPLRSRRREPVENGLEISILLAHYSPMNTVLDMGSLSRAEKLRAMEELWADLSRNAKCDACC